MATKDRADRPPTSPVPIRIADAAAVVLLLAGLCAMYQPIGIEVLGLPIRIERWTRVFVAAGGVLLVRHWFVPSPWIGARLARAWRARHERWPSLAAVTPIVVATRLFVLAIGYFAVLTFGLQPAAPPGMGQRAGPELPLRWDAGWYMGIATEGYDWTGDVHDQQTLNFFPAYPLAVRYVGRSLQVRGIPQKDVESWAATAFSMVAFFGACVYLHRSVMARFGREVASNSVLLLATYPFAYFFSAVYPEGLFLLCAVAAWYHLEREQFVAAAIFGLVAGLCRPNGGLLTIALGVWVLVHRRWQWTFYAASIAPIVGTLLYSAWAYTITGHPFIWAELQRTAFLRTYRGLDETIWHPLKTIATMGLSTYLRADPWEITNLAAGLLGIAAVWPVARRIGLGAATFVAIGVFVPLLNGGLVSMGRYTCVLFPMFVWLALRARGQSPALLSSCFALAQGLLAAAFFTWRPAF